MRFSHVFTDIITILSHLKCFVPNETHICYKEFLVVHAFKQYKSVWKMNAQTDLMEHVEIWDIFFASRHFHAFIAGAAQMTVFWVSFFCILSYTEQ
jgi:hypothetical protein